MSDDFEARRGTARHLFDHPPDVPAWVDDQIGAAFHDAVARWLRPAGAPLINHGYPDRDVATELLVAALLDCTQCPHLRAAKGPVASLCTLPTRRVDCARCARTVRRAPPDEDDRCDVCGSRGNVWFTQFRFALGPIVFCGDVGRCCAKPLGVEW
jgi:hypothetical protein